jgi:hypothetical protein
MAKARVGRPSKPASEIQTLVPVRFPPDLIERMDLELLARGDGQSRSGLIREYVAAALTRAERGRK